MRSLRNRLDNVKPNIAKIKEGGTGAVVASQALINLDAVPSNLIDLPGGILSLDVNRKLKPEVIAGLSVTGISIDGPLSLTINQVQAYTITDYDSFLTYTIAAIGGSVSRSGDTITYTAPGSAGPSGFTINGKTITIAIGANVVLSPSINNITNGANNISSTIALTTTVFTVSSGSDTHQWTDWQIATDLGFTTIVTQSLSDTVNKVSWTSGTLLSNTTYYARVRYKGNAYGYSNWSSVIMFTTKVSFTPSTEIAKYTPTTETSANFGFSVSVDSTGTRIVIGTRGLDQPSYSDNGAVYVYVKSGTSWIIEQIITPTVLIGSGGFGFSVDIDSTGTRIVVGAFFSSNPTGYAYIFTRSGSVWTQEARLSPSVTNPNMNFGFTVAIDDSGNRIVAGAWNGYSTGTISAGAVYIFLRTGVSWAQEAKVIASDAASGYNFGYSVAIDGAGSRIVVGSDYRTISGTGRGSAYIFLRSGVSWAQEAIIEPQPGNLTLTGGFGRSVDIDSSGTRAVVGCGNYDSNKGCISIYLRTGTSWALETFLSNVTPINGPQYGYSVSISDLGDTIAVGVPYYGGVGVQHGAMAIHTRTGVSWDTKSIIEGSSASLNDNFGLSVSIAGNGSMVSVGAPYVDVLGHNDSGAMYIFA